MANLVDSRSWWKARRGFGEIGAGGNIIGASAYNPPFTKIANKGELVYNSRAGLTVYYGTDSLGRYSREFPVGAVRCNPENFGAPADWNRACFVNDDDLSAFLETKPALATKVADEGQAFRLDAPGHIYFHTPTQAYGARTAIRQWVNTGTKDRKSVV